MDVAYRNIASETCEYVPNMGLMVSAMCCYRVWEVSQGLKLPRAHPLPLPPNSFKTCVLSTGKVKKLNFWEKS